MRYINTRLSFGARQSLIAALLLAPVMVLLVLFVDQCWKDIARAQDEVRGSFYLERIWTALTTDRPDLGPSRAADDARYGTAKTSSAFLRLKDQDQRWDAGVLLISDVADGSGLILDPDLDSYYAVIVMNPRLPFLYQAAAVVSTVAQGHGPGQAKLIDLAVDRLRVEGRRSQGRLEDAMKYNKDGLTRRRLAASTAALEAAIDRFGDTAEALESGGDVRVLQAPQSALRARIGRTFADTGDELRRLLRARIHRLQTKLAASLGSVLASLAAAGALAIAISRGLSQRIQGLTHAIDRLADDGGDVDIPNLDDANETGKIARALALLKESRKALKGAEQRLALALGAGRLGSWELDLKTGQLFIQPHNPADIGPAPGERASTRIAFLQHVHPDDRLRLGQAVDAAVTEHADLSEEFRLSRSGQDIAWVEIRGRAVYEPDGTPSRLTGVSIDVSDRKFDEARLTLMLDELNHRVKNTLATVQAIAGQTLRKTVRPAAFEKAFRGRLNALAATHELLTQASWVGASLRDIVGRALAPHAGEGDEERARVEGPLVMLDPTNAVTLHMAFHELATNAAKYGSLSTPEGRVDVTWRIILEEDRRVLELEWRESGGPPVSPPARRGFGSRLIEQGLARQLDAEVALAFEAHGVACRLRMPLDGKPRLAA